MKSNAENILTKGLKSGYAGTSVYQDVPRGPFTLKAAELSFPELQAEYNDHWIVKRVGGGQEIARIGTDMATRVFAGGIVSPEKLSALGIHESQVIAYLKKQLSVFADKTRLHEEVTPPADGDWQYRYRIVEDYPDVPVSVGVETVTYKGKEVFVHVFLNAPIA